MYQKLIELSEANDGKIVMSEILDGELSQWCKIQYNKVDSLPTEKLEKLKDIGFVSHPHGMNCTKDLSHTNYSTMAVSP